MISLVFHMSGINSVSGFLEDRCIAVALPLGLTALELFEVEGFQDRPFGWSQTIKYFGYEDERWDLLRNRREENRGQQCYWSLGAA